MTSITTVSSCACHCPIAITIAIVVTMLLWSLPPLLWLQLSSSLCHHLAIAAVVIITITITIIALAASHSYIVNSTAIVVTFIALSSCLQSWLHHCHFIMAAIIVVIIAVMATVMPW